MLLYGDPRIPSTNFIADTDIESVAKDAVDQLDTLGFVGVLERGNAAWHGLERLFDVKLEQRTVNVTGETHSPAPISPDEHLFLPEALDLLDKRNAADRVVYDHALARAGIRDRERLRLAELAFAGQLTRLGNLLGGEWNH